LKNSDRLIAYYSSFATNLLPMCWPSSFLSSNSLLLFPSNPVFLSSQHWLQSFFPRILVFTPLNYSLQKSLISDFLGCVQTFLSSPTQCRLVKNLSFSDWINYPTIRWSHSSFWERLFFSHLVDVRAVKMCFCDPQVSLGCIYICSKDHQHYSCS